MNDFQAKKSPTGGARLNFVSLGETSKNQYVYNLIYPRIITTNLRYEEYNLGIFFNT